MDLGGLEIPASVSHVTGIHYATALAHESASVVTVEHLLAALAGLGVDNAIVELSQAEVPIMDGSAAPFVYLIQEAGIRSLGVARTRMRILRPVSVADGDKSIAVFPSDEFRVSYTISFDHPLLRHQAFSSPVGAEVFAEQIAPARTFGFLSEVERLRQAGLAQGGSLENAVVLGETGVLNHPLRFEDEFVRHKVLDAIGDLSLTGYPLLGHVVVHRGGHALHTRLAAALLDEPGAWCLDEAGVPERAAAPATLPAERPVPLVP
jgi:UDP-3-O-[3-hydroxymyristoyl] N-acetylglucosamine deacetylase